MFEIFSERKRFQQRLQQLLTNQMIISTKLLQEHEIKKTTINR